VRMPQNGIRMEGIVALASGLSKNANLHNLDLQDNTFSAAGSKAMATALSSWANLQALNFSDCVLSDEGEVPEIIETLMKGSNPKLRDLFLQNNNLEANTLALLAQGIPTRLAALKSLELQWNEIEDDDENIQELADLLKARGGKLFMSDEDEEDEEEEKEEEAEEEEAIKEGEPVADKATDDALANLMSKVNIR